MLPSFQTLAAFGCQEIVIRKSRFIGYAKPVESEAEAIAFIDEIKRKHRDATHNCSAYAVGERNEWQKASDDGEPSGTAGKPILEVIKNRGLRNTAVVVTRYFGGIMLGAGGLVRAYTDGAVAGIDAAGVVVKVLRTDVTVEIDYTWYGKLENVLRDRGVIVRDTAFTDVVRVSCLPEAGAADTFATWMTDFTHGQALIHKGQTGYYNA